MPYRNNPNHTREATPTQICDIYFHIPKTAGQTLSNQLFREHRHKAALETHIGFMTPSAWKHFIQQLTTQAAQPNFHCSALIGHMKFGIHELLPMPSQYITFVRNPVKRFASYYYMVRRMGVIPSHHRFDPNRPDWNLPSFEPLVAELDNGQTRALANADWDLPFGQCTEKHLKTAKANIDKYFAFVGLTEHFDLSLAMLRQRFGWQWHLYVPKNVMPSKQEYRMPPDILEAITELNRYDRELYAYVSEKFWQEVPHYGRSLHLELGAFKACNAVHQTIHRTYYPVKLKLKRLWKARKLKKIRRARSKLSK